MRFRGWWGYILAVALLVAACTGTAPQTAPPTTPRLPTPTTSTPTTTTIPPVTTTTSTTVPVRLPANDVEDPTEAIVAIFEYVDWLATQPALADDLLRLVYAEACECHDLLLADFHEYVENGWIQDDQGIDIGSVSVSQTFEDGRVLLEVTYSYSPQFVVDQSGDRIRLVEDEWMDRLSLIGLEIGSDGRWRVGVIGIVGDVG